MSEQCRGVTYVLGAAVPCTERRGECIWHDEDGKCPPEDSWGRRLPYDDATKRTIAAQQRRSRGYDGGVEDERAAVVTYLRAPGTSCSNDVLAEAIERGDHWRENK